MSLSTLRAIPRAGSLHAMRVSLSASTFAARRPLSTSVSPLSRLLVAPTLSTSRANLSRTLSRQQLLTPSLFRPLSTSLSRLDQKPFKQNASFDDDPSEPPPPGPTDNSVKARLKYMIKSYGWYAVAVYLFLGVFDFGLSFGLIHVVGAEHVRGYVQKAKELVWGPPDATEAAEVAAEAKKGGHEGLYATILLAYAVHKTLFLPFRVAGVAAVTPPLVRWLRTRGWAGAAGSRRAVNQMQDKLRERRAARKGLEQSQEGQ